MSETGPKLDIDCGNCRPVSACCQGGTIELTLEEAGFMIRGGNKLRTIAQPADVDRDDVFCPTASVKDEDDPRYLRLLGTTQPLSAGLGRYFMLEPCGYLEPTEDGGQQCGVYDQRPFTCSRFEVGGSQCQILRQAFGVDTMTEETLSIVAMLNEVADRNRP